MLLLKNPTHLPTVKPALPLLAVDHGVCVWVGGGGEVACLQIALWV